MFFINLELRNKLTSEKQEVRDSVVLHLAQVLLLWTRLEPPEGSYLCI